MACTNCIKTKGVCEACRALDNNTEIQTVTYCKVCNAYLCDYHRVRWDDRIKAAIIKYIPAAKVVLSNKKVTKKKVKK